MRVVVVDLYVPPSKTTQQYVNVDGEKRNLKHTCMADVEVLVVGLKDVTSDPGAKPMAISFCRLYATRSGLM